MRIVTTWLGLLRRFGQKAGPYLLLEMVMPGGTLLALLLFLYQRKKPDIAKGVRQAVVGATRMLAGAFEQRVLVALPRVAKNTTRSER
jgi:hypothetical protein